MTRLLRRVGICALLVSPAMAQSLDPLGPGRDPSRLGSIEGMAISTTGEPVAGADIQILGVGRVGMAGGDVLRLNYPAVSDAQGRFSVSRVEPGQYAVIAQHADYSPFDADLATFADATMMGGVPPPGLASPSPSLTVKPGQSLTGVEIRMVPLTALSGRVTDENGDPMKDVVVRPMRTDMELNGHLRLTNGGPAVQTNAEGEYRLSVYTGRWYLSFLPGGKSPSGDADRGYVTTYFPGMHESNLAVGIDATGPPLPGLNVRLQKTAIFHARGKLAGFTPDPDFRIVPTHETGGGRPSVVDEGQRVADDGTFDVKGLTPGPWTLIICKYGQHETYGRLAVRITDADLADVVIPVQPPATLSGFFRTIAKRDATVASRDDLNSFLQLTPLEPLLDTPVVHLPVEGAFALKNVEAGRYRVDVQPVSGGFVQSVTLAGQDGMEHGIDLSGGAAAIGPLQIVISMTARQIMGTVTNPDGAAVTSALVTLVPEGPTGDLFRPELHLMTRADGSGHFAISSVAPGTYRVYAWERLDAQEVVRSGTSLLFLDPGFPRLFDNLSAVVTVAANESKAVSLTLISTAKSRRR